MQRSYFSIIGANVVINVVFVITLLLDTLHGTNHKIIKLQLFVLLIALLIITGTTLPVVREITLI